jgi:hypothetical protein
MMPAPLRRLLLVAIAGGIASILYLRLHAVRVYSMPAQRSTAVRPVSVVLQIHENPMDDAWAPVIGGILPAEKGSAWAWTNAQPHLRFRIEETDRWMFQIKFATVGQVIRTAGPQTIEIAINGAPVKTVTADEAREFELSFPVDAAVIKPGSMNDVELRIKPVYTAPDGVPLGVLLHSAGFLENR